jgi:hypothetical protein
MPAEPAYSPEPGVHARSIAIALALLATAGVLLGDFAKEDRIAITIGSIALVGVAWAAPSRWPIVRFAATAAVGTCIAFAGIVGLQSPDAAAAWLIGAGLAGTARYWVDSLMRSATRMEAEQIAAQIEQIATALRAEPCGCPGPQVAARRPLPASALAVGIAIGLLARRARH